MYQVSRYQVDMSIGICLCLYKSMFLNNKRKYYIFKASLMLILVIIENDKSDTLLRGDKSY